MRPDPRAEIRVLGLRALRGPSYWASFPVTRLDLAVGAYDEISSADVPGLRRELAAALPGLIEHRCSVGRRGGFLRRLERGTYAPHILEHVALELQAAVGHDVGFGRARGAGAAGEYTVVFEHRHEPVGRRTAELALELVLRGLAGEPLRAEEAVRELRALAAEPDPGPRLPDVACGVTAGTGLPAIRAALARRLGERRVVPVTHRDLLDQGLPYRRSEIAVVGDAEPDGLPDPYRDPDRVRRLVSVVADGVPRGGIVIVPAAEREVQALVLDAGRRVAVFGTEMELEMLAPGMVAGAATRHGRLVARRNGAVHDLGPVSGSAPKGSEAAAALAALLLDSSEIFSGDEDGG